MAKIFLVIYLNMRLPLAETQDQQAHDLQQAQDYTEQVRMKLNGGPGNWLKSHFQIGEALTGLAAGQCNESLAREMLAEAVKTDPQNLLAAELTVDLLQGQLTVGPQSQPGSAT